MNTYIQTNDGREHAAIRASRAEIKKVRPDLSRFIVPANKSLKRKAYMSIIPTYYIRADGALIPV